MSSLSYTYPVEGGGLITSFFGARDTSNLPLGASSYHNGIDIAAKEGTNVLAAFSGIISSTGYNDSKGNYIVIDHGNGLFTEYGHLSEIVAKVGQKVSDGAAIGTVGSTGISTGSHLDFRIKENGTYLDPLEYGLNGGTEMSIDVNNILGILKKYWLYIAGGLLLFAVISK